MLEDYFEDDFADEFNNPEDVASADVADFFRDSLLRTRKALSPQSFKKFAVLDENGARVAFLLGYAEARELPVEVENYERKDPTKANSLKEAGNAAFKCEHYEIAIEEYNNAVLVAPKDELGVILANRSAAFAHLDRFEQALRDCDEALKVGYPDHLLHKLEERRARCLLALKYHASAMEAFKRAIRALKQARMPTDKRLKQEADMCIMITLMQKGEQMGQTVSHEELLKMETRRFADQCFCARALS